MWRPEKEKFPHLDKMLVRSQIPAKCMRILRGILVRHILSLEFFVQNGVPKFSWKLGEVGLAYGVPERPEVKACSGTGYASPVAPQQ